MKKVDHLMQGSFRDSPMQPVVLRSLALLLLLLSGAMLTPDVIAAVLLRRQDIWLLLLLLAAGTFAFLPLFRVNRPIMFGWRVLLVISVGVILACYLGHYWLLGGYDLTRDEQMANFDSAIFSAGHLIWPLPREWQAHAAELNMRFMLSAERPVAWISAYLPMNALLRAGIGLIADPALTGPLLTGLSVPLLWSCARRLWPERSETAAICVLLLVSAGQVVMMGMTAYAMPAHLFFNLVWLRLFLADRRMADGAAVLAGFIATGLHQPLFHPMFVAPFMLLLLVERDWRRLAIFVPGYAAIAIFWFAWPFLMHGLVVGREVVATTSGGSSYVDRLVRALGRNRANVSTMAANILRFCTWQNVVLIPLLFASWPAVRRDRFAAALAGSFLLPILVMAILLPSQGHGFGYRYLYGVLGNAALLAGYGWNRISDESGVVRSAFVRATAASLLILMPVQAWMAHCLYAPFAQANARIDASGADYALIRDGQLIMLHDLVLTDIPQVACRLTSRSPDFARWASVFRPERCLSSRKRPKSGGSSLEPAAFWPGRAAFPRGRRTCPAAFVQLGHGSWSCA